MRCEECQSLLEEFFDEELDRSTAEAVRGHISSCASCAGPLDDLKAENALYAGYEHQVQVPPNTWRSIQDRIRQPIVRSESGRQVRNQWIAALVATRVNAWVVLASVLLSVGVTVFLMKQRWESPLSEKVAVPPAVEPPSSSQAEGSNLASTTTEKRLSKESNKENSRMNERSQALVTAKQTSPLRVPSAVRGNSSAERLVKEAEQKYLAAIAMLSFRVSRNQNRLDEDTKLKFEQALTSIDRTIARTRIAVRKHPEDPIAVQYMLTAYSRKVDVLREMVNY